MKTLIMIVTCLIISLSGKTQTWDEWFRQKKTQRKYLLEQIAKLQIYLGYVKKGYDIARDGLVLIGDIKNADFSIHRIFFGRLKTVNPAIRRYGKVAEIIVMQSKMISKYKSQFSKFSQSELLSENEVDYIYGVLTNIINQATADIDLLTEIIENDKLEMSDDERIERIDDLHKNMAEKHKALFSLIDHISLLIHQRQAQTIDLKRLKNLY
jgi:hypothetical protein